MTSGEWQVKPRGKFVNIKIVSYKQKHNKTGIPKMKTKRKEKEKKKGKKRNEEKKVLPGIDLETFDAPGQSFTTGPRGTRIEIRRNFIIKPFEPY